MNEKDNLSLVIHKKGDLRLEQKPIPSDIGPNDVLCKTHSCGICGTDIHYWIHGFISSYVIKEPLILGHEVSALVAKVGSNVRHLKPGDRVAIEPAIPCRTCVKCKEGMYNHCPISNTQINGSPHFDGLLTRYFTHPSDFCFKLPDNVSWQEGAMVEPLAVVVHALRRVKLTLGQTVLVCGAGPLGLMCLAAARAFGASRVVITDINPFRLNVAKQMGADDTVLIDLKNFEFEEVVKEIKTKLGGCGSNITFECTGSENSTKVAIYSTNNGGKVALIGLGPLEVMVPLVNASLREVDIIGVNRFRNCFPLAIYLLESGKIDLKPLVTHKYALEKSLDAFKKMIEPNNNAIKIQIQCNKDFE